MLDWVTPQDLPWDCLLASSPAAAHPAVTYIVPEGGVGRTLLQLLCPPPFPPPTTLI